MELIRQHLTELATALLALARGSMSASVASMTWLGQP